MSHMVIYRGADGKPGYQQAEDIHDAVTFVEQMRNEDGVEHARIFRLEEVVFEYRPYYRVELSASGVPEPVMGVNPLLKGTPPSPAPVPPAPTPVSVTPPPTPAPTVDITDEAAATSDGAYEGSEPSSIAVEESPDPDSVAGNGARRGLFGR